MVPVMENFRSTPRVRTPGRMLRIGRAALLVGWVVFALATTLSTCIQTIAAPVGDHAQNVTATFAGTPMDHLFNNESVLAEYADDGFESPCCHLASAMPRNVDISLALTTNGSPSGWVAIEGVATPSPVVLTHSKSLGQLETPAPPRRLYLRTLHLLI
ncbi:MAG: hypothetical protein A2W68_13350 [Betaproteobacteria bacterium RIFCSPLOWO2_02_64_14]|nr:MAG: hypothetical protein A2W68_13350 [Betaproteobacteria bacterium RIFCSPLOWO2_02_64_14]